MSRISGRHIVLLEGGTSHEREISLRTGAACAEALVRLGCVVERLDATKEALASLTGMQPDCVFLALHGGAGEDGRVQGFLDALGLAYTGSGVLGSALAMDKVRSKRVFDSAGVPTPSWEVVSASCAHPPFLPCVVKRSLEGSSVGVTLVRSDEEWTGALAQPGRGVVLVERLVDGRELTVAVFDGKALGVLEITTTSGVYDYETKYNRTDNTYTVLRADDPESAPLIESASDAAEAAYDALGCRGMARVDMMVDGRGVQVLEVNTLPGMTATSLVPKIAAACGWSFDLLVEELVLAARCDGEGANV
jgi:D-alanine-D-alanine ligase